MRQSSFGQKQIPQDALSIQIHEPESLSTFKNTMKNIQ